ncbi:MAG: sigma-70 family RNA polymerase sigma factor [Planctomycetia bacterium]|nr:sigma-70 family RNA polymerase sigma factor [Planctomycetia bacterium]
MPSSDHELMERFRRGEAAALEEIVRRWQGKVAHVLARLAGGSAASLNGHADVDDLAQEVFLRVVRGAERYRSDFAFSTWIYRIAVNVARDYLRRRRRRPPPSPLSEQDLAGASEPPSARLDQAETARAVEEALAALPEELREPLVLRQFGEVSFSEMAGVLSVPESTLKARVHSALLKLRGEFLRRGIVDRETSERKEPP